jgi:hypothetical protein
MQLNALPIVLDLETSSVSQASKDSHPRQTADLAEKALLWRQFRQVICRLEGSRVQNLEKRSEKRGRPTYCASMGEMGLFRAMAVRLC